jgi:hypothetical protein
MGNDVILDNDSVRDDDEIVVEEKVDVFNLLFNEENPYRNPVARCSNCKFFCAKEVRGTDMSECRKNPPFQDGSFPRTRFDEWCGSHPII